MEKMIKPFVIKRTCYGAEIIQDTEYDGHLLLTLHPGLFISKWNFGALSFSKIPL